MKKMRVAIIGQGRSGRDIHGNFFRSESNDFVDVVAIVEADEFRRNRAAEEFGCDVYVDYTELFARKDIDVVVNASYSQMHYPITKEFLLHGFNVLTEKPFGRTSYECAELIKIAKERGVTVAAFHQSLLSPIFLKIKEILASGILGKIIQIDLTYSGFARRWDWQTMQCCCAGSVYNTGPHPIGQALDLLGWDKDTRVVYSRYEKCFTSGDAEDYAKILLAAPGKPTVDIEINSADAFAANTFKICGTAGTLTATQSDYKIKYLDFEKLEPRPLIRESLSGKNGEPVYCSEKIDATVVEGSVKGSSFDSAVFLFYKMLYGNVMEGKPLVITPEMACEVIRVIERCYADNPLPIIY
ncbi:MAG: Gfo/Idh/MocA family oxidoreductase [Clostridia bacterium]|nr:Gfo/Idh/MocA family oxidoreductase [Clostridia bacterium]